MAIRFADRRADTPRTDPVASVLPASEGWVLGEGDAIIDNPMCSTLLYVGYPVRIMWRYNSGSLQERGNYEIGAVGMLEHRITKRRRPGVMPIRRFAYAEDLAFMFNKLLAREIKLVDAPTYVLGENASRGERIETISEIHARLPRRHNGKRRRRL